MVIDEERKAIVDYSGKDHFVHWQDDIYYLDKGPCPYLKNGLCSVQEVKPFVCQIFPFVPRVVDGEFWLYSAGECDAAVKLSEHFIERAKALARAFFSGRTPEQYAQYWNQNKQGDFDEAKVVLKLKVSGYD
jgi:Fe-S-cluster containining protein